MTPRALAAWLASYAALVLAASAFVYARTAPARFAPPPRDAAVWAVSALERWRRGEAMAPAPASARTHRAPASIVVLAFDAGRPVAKSVGSRTLEAAVRRAIVEFESHPSCAHGTSMRDARDGLTRFSIGVPLGDGYAPVSIPLLRNFAYVPTRDALVVRHRGREAVLVPDEMVSRGLDAGAIATGLPELDVGVPIDRAVDALADELGVSREALLEQGAFLHRRIRTISADAYPNRVEPTLANARLGVLRAASYLVRHLGRFGHFDYEVDARSGASLERGYLLARHAGAAYFLAQAARIAEMPEAASASERAVIELVRRYGRPCGEGTLCIEERGQVDAGTAALTLLAAAELERTLPSEARRSSIRQIAEFLVSLQRDDGEFMHLYDVREERRVDVQLPYFSGEIALALLRANEILGEARYLRAAERGLRYLARRAWDFPADRYVHAEEHWTCIAAGEARGRLELPELVEFCASVFAWNEWVQIAPGESAFPVDGAYGLGPWFAPRFPALGTRIESFVELHRAFVHEGRVVPGMRAHLDRGIAAILRFQLAPGPTRHMANPDVVDGGIGGSVTDPIVRIDHVQHVGSALARYVELLEAERHGPARVGAARAAVR